MAVEHTTPEIHGMAVLAALVRYLHTAPQDVVVDATPPGVYMSVTKITRPPLHVFQCIVHGSGRRYPIVIECGRPQDDWVDVYSAEFDSEFDGRQPFALSVLLRDVAQSQMLQVLTRKILADLRTLFFLSEAHAAGRLVETVHGLHSPEYATSETYGDVWL